MNFRKTCYCYNLYFTERHVIVITYISQNRYWFSSYNNNSGKVYQLSCYRCYITQYKINKNKTMFMHVCVERENMNEKMKTETLKTYTQT